MTYKRYVEKVTKNSPWDLHRCKNLRSFSQFWSYYLPALYSFQGFASFDSRQWWVLRVFTPRMSLNLCLYCWKELVLYLLRFFAFAEVGIHVEVYKQDDQSDAIRP